MPPREEAKDPIIGTTIADRYEILALISSGGMGRVYRAEQKMLGRMVAIKIIDPRVMSVNQTSELTARFMTEARAASRAPTTPTSSASSTSGGRSPSEARLSSPRHGAARRTHAGRRSLVDLKTDAPLAGGRLSSVRRSPPWVRRITCEIHAPGHQTVEHHSPETAAGIGGSRQRDRLWRRAHRHGARDDRNGAARNAALRWRPGTILASGAGWHPISTRSV